MSQETIRSMITARFASGWASFAPVAYPNRKFTEPKNTLWGRLSVQQADRFDAAIGAQLVRDIGVVYLQLFAPDESGSREALEAADRFCTAFDNVTLTRGATDIQFHRARVQTIGKTTQGPFQINVSVDYRAETDGNYVAPSDGTAFFDSPDQTFDSTQPVFDT